MKIDKDLQEITRGFEELEPNEKILYCLELADMPVLEAFQLIDDDIKLTFLLKGGTSQTLTYPMTASKPEDYTTTWDIPNIKDWLNQ